MRFIPAAKRAPVADELAAITKRGRGHLDPQKAVKWAREHPQSTLHSMLEWDDSKAGHNYRVWQVRQIIVQVQVEYPDGKTRQVYVSPVQSRGAGGYTRLVDILSDEERREAFLADALAELERVCEKYQDLAELSGVRAAVRLVRVGARQPAMEKLAS